MLVWHRRMNFGQVVWRLKPGEGGVGSEAVYLKVAVCEISAAETENSEGHFAFSLLSLLSRA